MDHLNHHIKATSSITHLLVYADNYYVGFFQKQGFTKSASLDQSVCMECVKGYEGVTLMQYAIGTGLDGRQYELKRANKWKLRLSEWKIQSLDHDGRTLISLEDCRLSSVVS
ncbi:histone acetyltransferase [Fusarium oxysporum f. sp. lycopersici 4287]|uniref:Histone acetyltransferase n=2 Tax=Fusarium oxysporum TaxID=5507 RepID=A0A0J9VF34_FUSO4|nr:histone acetyltransferase [Fusarium oxysporum f. sp. lycopersici 4287]EXK27574.1 histone acetyltransferase [Fusarium oxysporum f. sp. melonis 26406]KNB09560.1 histone acetyltransferase [Fusarium oxysporum f. sp. lycopersici 4287]